MSDQKEASDQSKTESFALRLSVVGYLFMAFLGIFFHLITYSEAILLDGVYSLISFIMALAAGKVAKVVEKPASDTFNFGYAHFEPFLNSIRGILILVLCVFAFFSAVHALLYGGRPLSAGPAVFYGIGAASGCTFMAFLQKYYSKKAASPLLAVDAKNWIVDGVVSSVVGATFITVYLIQDTSFAYLTPYIDPALVTLMTLFLIRVPITTVRDNMLQLLQVAPNSKLQSQIRDKVKDVVQELPVKDSYVRMVKIGRFFYIMVQLVLPKDYSFGQMEKMDKVRADIKKATADVPGRNVIDVIFTADETWASSP